MYPKHFIERFWEGEQKNQVFVCMPFDGEETKKFDVINKTVKDLGFENAFRQGIESGANSIPEKIFDDIANSKLLLFDLSDDERFPQIGDEKISRVNQNVMYELGIATAIREPYEIILIRKKTEKELKLPFDIQGLFVNTFPDNLTPEFIKSKIEDALEKQDFHKNKRIKSAIESIDELGLFIMNTYGRIPRGRNHFNSSIMDANQKASLFRLIDLGIIKFAWSIWSEKGFEYAYHWTNFGYLVMQSLGIHQIDEEKFKDSPEDKLVKEAEKKFFETKDKFFGKSEKVENNK